MKSKMIQHRFAYSVPAAIFATGFGALPARQPGWHDDGWRRKSMVTFAASTIEWLGSASPGRVADQRETEAGTA